MQSKDHTFIDQMTKMIIRPRRDVYHPQRLEGPSQLIVKGKMQNKHDKQSNQYLQVNRKDFNVDVKGQKVKVSYYSPIDRQNKKDTANSGLRSTANPKKKCIVYLHANSGSRLEGLELVRYVLPLGWNLALFDYRGSGISDGEYTSMGVTQSEDLVQVLSSLSQNQQCQQFGLWGRSMGAVTILYYLLKQYSTQKSKQKIQINAIVLDSPFSSLRKLMFQIGSSTIHLPQFVLLPIVSSISEKLTQKIGVDILEELNLIESAKKIRPKSNSVSWQTIQALFLTSTQDKLVNCAHVEELYKELPFSQKELYYYNGQHNDVRSDGVKIKCAGFLCEKESSKKERTHNTKVQEAQIGKGQGRCDNEKKEIGSPLLKRSDIATKMTKLNIDEDKRDTQFLLPPPNKKTSINSPKFQKVKMADINSFKSQNQIQQKSSKIIDLPSQKSSHNLNSSIGQPTPSLQTYHHQIHHSHLAYKSYEPHFASHPPASPYPYPQSHYSHLQQSYNQQHNPSPSPSPPLPPPPSIIINHNYNVSVNVFDGNRSLQIQHQQIIPPINFNQPGHMTDRISQHPLPGNRYYIPYTAKIQRRSSNHMAESWSNTLNNSGDSGLNSSLVFGQPSKSTILKPPIMENSLDSQHSSQQLTSISKRIEIPLIKFEGIDYDANREQPNSSSGLKFRENVEKIKSSEEIKMNVGPTAERHKLSLTEIRKMQREQQERCNMKSSKVISIKDKQERQDISHDFQKLNLKKEAMILEQSWKEKSQDNDRNKLRSMKTSLMARKKIVERKSSDSMSGTIKSFIDNRQNTSQNFCGGLSSMGRATVHSPKTEQHHKK